MEIDDDKDFKRELEKEVCLESRKTAILHRESRLGNSPTNSS